MGNTLRKRTLINPREHDKESCVADVPRCKTAWLQNDDKVSENVEKSNNSFGDETNSSSIQLQETVTQDTLTAHVCDQSQQVDELTVELEALSEELETTKRENKILQEKWEELETTKKENKNLKEKCAQYESTINLLEKLNQENKELCSQLQQQSDSLMIKIQSLEQLEEEAQETILSYEIKEQVWRENEEKLQDKQKEDKVLIEELKQKIVALQNELDTEKALRKTEKEVDEQTRLVGTKIGMKQNGPSSARKAWDNKKPELKSGLYDTRTDACETKSMEVVQLQERENKKGELQSVLYKTMTEACEIENMEGIKLQEWENKNPESESGLYDIITDACETESIEIIQLKEWEDKKPESESALYETMVDACEKRKKENIKLQECLNQKEQQIENIKRDWDKNEQQKNKKIKRLEGNLRHRTIECENRTDQLIRLQAELEKTNDRVNSFQTEISKEKNKTLEHKNYATRLQKKIELKEKNISKLTEDKKQALQENTQLQGKLREKTARLIRLRNKCKALETKFDTTVREHNEREQKLKEETSQVQIQNHFLSEEKKKREQEIEEITKAQEASEKTALEQLDFLRNEYKIASEDKRKALDQLDVLRNEKEQVEDQLRHQNKLDQRRSFVKWFIEQMECFDPWAKRLAISQDTVEIDREHPLGRGSWGEVYNGFFGSTPVAIKSFHNILRESADHLNFYNEILFGYICRHPNIVQVMSCSVETESSRPLLLMEKMCFSLYDLLNGEDIRRDVDYEESKISIARDVGFALEYLHNRVDSILHRDVSAKNVLLCEREKAWHAKLSDFGEATLESFTNKQENPGCPRYAAPEAIDPAEQTTKMDIFSYSILMLELFTNDVTFEPTTRYRIAVILGRNSLLREVCQDCFSEVPDIRPSAADVIQKLTNIMTSQQKHQQPNEREKILIDDKVLNRRNYMVPVPLAYR